MNTKTKRLMAVGFAVLTFIVMVMAVTGLIEETIGVCVALAMTVGFTLALAIVAYKQDIKILSVLMGIFMVIAVVLLGINIYSLLTNKDRQAGKFQMQVSKDTSEKTQMFSHDGYTYYRYNLSEILVNMEKGNVSLKDAISNEELSLNEILEMGIPNENTSGYKIYYDGGQGKANDSYSVVVCDTKDVIFAPFDYKYDGTLCEKR